MIRVTGGVSGHITYKNVQNVGKREKIWLNSAYFLVKNIFGHILIKLRKNCWSHFFIKLQNQIDVNYC